ncbi:MAG: NYN domain-containing protein [Sciscionella sp.]
MSVPAVPAPDEQDRDPISPTVDEGQADVESQVAVEKNGPGSHLLGPATLPDSVRARLAEIVASAIGDLPGADIPPSLRAVAKFTPAKRARLATPVLLQALADSAAFRAAVLRWCSERRPAALDIGAPNVTSAASAAVLLGSESAQHYLELAARRATDAALCEERDAAVRRASGLTDEVAALRAQLADATGVGQRSAEELRAEVERLRKRLREQGVRLRKARDEAEAAIASAASIRAESELERKTLTAERDREQQRADVERLRAERAEADTQIARQSAREARQADEVRLSLLVETLDGAVTGLRRELAIGGTGPRPADTVRGATPPQGTLGRVEDPAALDRLLALPAVHLVVDGYNVTKTGYPELSLADQRDRLIHQLAALAARTGAEATLVFDGAGVVAMPQVSPRGVRVLFSDPGVLADDVIRALVTAEPEGRPVVVVTSDRAVADSVRRRGAHSVPSVVLLARVGRV